MDRVRLCAVASLAVKYQLFDEVETESDSDSDEEVIYTIIALNKIKNSPQRIEKYLEITLEKFTTKQFQENFRISHEKYLVLLRTLSPHLNRKINRGRNTIDVEKQILSVLWLLATPDSYRSVGERFNLGKSSLSVCFTRIINILCKLAALVIKWPSENERIPIKDKFRRMGNLPDIIGAVDGTYINIKAPQNDPETYITRKCNYSITLQAICDSHLEFIDIFVGYPGSVNDNRIFRNSHIFQDIRNNSGSFFRGEEYIIGDKAYPLLDWCIPPYINRGNMTPSRIHFNIQHARTRQTIERSFALLFGRFRRLKYLDMNCTEFIPSTILAACVLHNLCINTDLDEDFIREGALYLVQQAVDEIGEELGNPVHIPNIIGGQEKRDLLCQKLFQRRNNN